MIGTSSAVLGALFGLDGKAAAVTGAAEGIGREIARHLAGAGASVAILDRNSAGAAEAARAIGGNAHRAIAIGMDLSDEISTVDAFREVTLKLGHLDILVNCAGIQNRELITETSAELWDLLQRINSRGLFICLREAAKIMRAAGKGGRIINISSMGSIHPVMPGLAAYNASKAAVNALTRSAALELSGDRITVNAILPGAVATVGAGKAPGPAPSGRVVAGLPPLGRLATPTDIAAAVLLFAGTGGEAITGQTLIVDAGYLLS
ncbi:MAG TPA: SDR family oxidoreductase [Steroidobacteraceae bacterium]|nr:SDR family oxidoreductase [Steroidobacteraceae bacterium]